MAQIAKDVAKMPRFFDDHLKRPLSVLNLAQQPKPR